MIWSHAFPAAVGALLLTASAARAPAQTADPLDLVPADSLLCYYGRPLPGVEAPASQPSTLAALVDLGARLAGRQLTGGFAITLRGAELFHLALRYPHALALIDARAKPVETDPRARRVDRLRCAFIIRHAGDAEPFLRIVQKTVNDQTTREKATLVTRQAGRWSYQELRDERLPAWCVIAWGQLAGNFVLTLGEDMWPLIADTAAGDAPALSRDAWYLAARQPPGGEEQRTPLIEIFVAATELRSRLDPLLDNRASEFFAAWNAEDLERAHWALGLEGRALFCLAHFRLAGRTVVRLYADPDLRDRELLRNVPEDTNYAIYHISLNRFFRWFFRGVLIVQGPEVRARIEHIWEEVQREYGFDVDRNLLVHLGDYVVLHNSPTHPLNLPVALTGLIQIRGDAGAVRTTLDRMAGAFRDALNKPMEEGRAPATLDLEQAPDGVWYLQFGPIAGPAWTVRQRFIVFSWSPWALRTYLESMPHLTPNPATQPAEEPTTQASQAPASRPAWEP